MAGPVRVLIIDEHDHVRSALAARLNAASEMVVVGETGDAEEGLRHAQTLQPDVVLVETKRADGRGLEIVHWIVHCSTPSQVIVLTSYPSDWERAAALRAGAVGYLLKEIGSSKLIQQIRSVARS